MLFIFLFAYVLLSARPLEMFYGIDHNVQPRQDLSPYLERSVQDGKIMRLQLDLLKRNEAAHADAREHFPVFAGGVLFASVTRVANEKINAACLVYGVARAIYAVAYLSSCA
ncbi:uncharacterized protein A1O5_05158 [Cladophialophora psammophila CBS 110553]|uniref:Uncharacterized protein n=1 Tax=Cladophialophora psammophila CBS 110553 TaxID=1182543 RepID=W9X368_9EURO|nr:uncharacterized protein A1O5_05158 [Cladophialophora psammophila CBS 110553]EXJ71351.1 hypothetical protein A1O5_05158 [Cladophialophora psammophila CBS 110553]